MDDEALVTLVIGAATVFGAVVATVTAFVVEWRRARHLERRDARKTQERRTEQRKQEVETALAEVRSCVLRLSVDAQLVSEMRKNADARLDQDDLPNQIRVIRAHYPAAVNALESLWTLCPGAATRAAVDELGEAIAWAFRCTRSAGGQHLDSEKIESRIQERLRALGLALAQDEAGPVPLRATGPGPGVRS